MVRPSPMELIMRRLLGEMEQRLTGRLDEIDQRQGQLKEQMKTRMDGLEEMVKKTDDTGKESWAGDRFLLALLNPTLLEKVITKLNSTSYFRIQQTCHAMKDFIEKSKNISVHLDCRATFRIREKKPVFTIDGKDDRLFLDFNLFHGVRLSSVSIVYYPTDPYEVLCDLLKSYRFTSMALDLKTPYWTVDKCAIMMNLLKCNSVEIHGQILDAVYDAKHLTEVNVTFENGEQAVDAAPRLLSTFSNVRITVVRRLTAPDLTEALLRAILKGLFTLPQNLKSFSLDVYSSDKMYCYHRMKKLLDRCGVNLLHGLGQRGRRSFFVINLANGFRLKITFSRNSAIAIGYEKKPDQNLEPIALVTKNCECCAGDEGDQEEVV